MSRSKILLFFVVIVVTAHAQAQQVEILNNDRPVSLRGLSVVDDNVVWVSGSKGTVGKSVDGGKTWSWISVPGFETRDFRDIEGFDKNTAVIIAVSEPAAILRTIDSGTTWKLVYENKTKGMFLDAMDFVDDLHGVVVGDAIKGKFFIAHTADGGKSWSQREDKYITVADTAAGCFASSGTNIRLKGKHHFFFVSGGKSSHIISDEASYAMPFDQSKSSTGANSLAIRQTASGSSDLWVAVGGDFAADSLRENNCFISKDAGKSWVAPAVSPSGYRSCVEFISDTKLVTCGLNGVDVSLDEGKTWSTISSESFHACRKAKRGSAVFLSGGNGRIGVLRDKL